MNQSFKKKAIATSVLSALALVNAGVAYANQFADSSAAVGQASGVNVAKGANVSLGNQFFLLTETPAAGTWGTNGGTLVFTLSNAKFASAGAIGSANGLNGMATGGTGGTATSFATGSIDTISINMVKAGTGSSGIAITGNIDSTRTILTITAPSGAFGQAATASVKLSGITLDTSASTTDSPITLATSGTLSLLGSPSSVTLATPKTSGYTAALASGQTLATAGINGAVTLPTIRVSENIPGMLGVGTAGQAASITISAPSGVTILQTGSTGSVATLTSTQLNSATFGTTGSSIVTSSNTLASFAMDTGFAITTSQAGYVDISGLQMFVPTGAATGDLNVTVGVKLAGATSTTTSTLKVANIVAAGTTSAAYRGGVATPSGSTLNTLYIGRSYTNGFGSLPGTPSNDQVRVSENAPGTLAQGGAVTLTLSNGVKFGTGGAAATVAASGGSFALSAPATAASASSVASYTISAAAGASSTGVALFSFNGTAAPTLDLSAATAGDLNVAVGGTTNVTSSTVKIANLAAATTASASAAVPTLIGGATSATAIPDIVITESNAGALNAAGFAVRLPTGVTFDNTVVPTVTATGGLKVAAAAVGNYQANSAGTAAAEYQINVTQASTSGNGGVGTITISGLKVKAASTASSGDVNASIHGVTTFGGASSATDESATAADAGAMPSKATIKVAAVGSATVPTVPAATVTGSVTSQTITTSITPASNDLSKQGSVFVAAVVQTGEVFFMSSTGAWTQFTSCATTPAYSTGTLAAVSSIPVVTASDLSGLIGTQVYVGYGVGGALSPAGTACTNMLNNGTYSLTYTVQ